MGLFCLYIIFFFFNMQIECVNFVLNFFWYSNIYFVEILLIGLVKFVLDLVDKGYGLLYKGLFDIEIVLM